MTPNNDWGIIQRAEYLSAKEIIEIMKEELFYTEKEDIAAENLAHVAADYFFRNNWINIYNGKWEVNPIFIVLAKQVIEDFNIKCNGQ